MLKRNIFTSPIFLVIDLFCGAGGVTTGFVRAGMLAFVIACVNHDHTAIISHKCNHSKTHHFEEDIRKMDVQPLVDLLKHYKKMYPKAYSILWGSLECQGHSKAAGNRAKNAESRTLSEVFVDNYVKALKTDYVMIENVVEFIDHGPTQIMVKKKWVNEYGNEVWDLMMRKNEHGEKIYGHKVIKERKGEYFKAFNEDICAEGYEVEWEKMNAADYGAFTSRQRLFMIFKRPGLPNAWPEKTHSKTGANGLPRWKAVKEKIDFSDEGYSIFNRKGNLSIPKRFRKDIGDNSINRIYEGFIKHVAGGKEEHNAFITKYYSGKPESCSSSVQVPLGTIPTENRFGLVSASKTNFIGTYHGNGHNTHSMDTAGPTLPCGDSVYLVTNTPPVTPAHYIDKHFGNSGNPVGQNSSVDDPLGSITKNDKNKLITAVEPERVQGEFSFIDSTNYNNTPQSANEPLCTITADRHYPYILNPSHGGNTHSVDDACPTIIASQHKAPLYVINVCGSGYVVPIYDTDSEAVVRLKTVMAMYGYGDIKMRMLKVKELLVIQGFPEDYLLAGNQEEQKKHIGNSVEPNQVTVWAEALAQKLFEMGLAA